MDVDRVQDSIRKNIAYLPGGTDRQFSRLLVFGSQGEWAVKPYEEVLAVTTYLAQVAQTHLTENMPTQQPMPSTQVRQAPVRFTVLVDMRKGWIKYLKIVLKVVQHALFPNIRQVLIIKPEQFLEKQRLFVDIVLEGYEFKVNMVSVHKLSRYIDVSQLPPEFGGTFPYDAETWINLRQRYENFLLNASRVLRQMKRSPAEVADVEVGSVVKKGEDLLFDLRSSNSDEEELNELRKPLNPEHARSATRVNTILSQIKVIKDPPPEIPDEEQQQMSEAAMKKQFLHGVENVRDRLITYIMLDWFLNAGERWLLTLHEIGESVDEAEQLVKEHETLRIKANEVLSKVGEVNTLADRLTGSGAELGSDVEERRNKLDSVARTFMARVRRQADMCAMSVSLHSIVHEHNRKLDDLLQVLCSELKAEDAGHTEDAIDALEQQIAEIDKNQEEVLAYGERMLEQLTVTEYNCVGQEVTRDYVAGLAHVRQVLADTVGRRRRCADLVDVRRLKLQQSLQLFTVEKDCEQSIAWLAELYDNLRNDFSGPTDGSEEASKERRLQQSKLEHTARKTHDYGRQLAAASEGLRRSLRLPIHPQSSLLKRLDSQWAMFCRLLAENDSKIYMSKAFHSAAREVSSRFDELHTEITTQSTQPDGASLSPNAGPSRGTATLPLNSQASGETILPNGFAMSTNSKRWNTSLPDFSDAARGQLNASAYQKVQSQRRRLNGDVKELRHMAQVLTNNPSTTDYNPSERPSKYSPRSINSDDSATHIRALLDEIEIKQRQLDVILDGNEEPTLDAR